MGTTLDEVWKATALINLLVKVHHQLVAVEDCILEIVDKLDCTEVTCVHTELAEHAVAQVVLVIYQLALLLACLGSSTISVTILMVSLGHDFSHNVQPTHL